MSAKDKSSISPRSDHAKGKNANTTGKPGDSAKYEVFRIRYQSMPIFHEAIYIEVNTEGGNLYHVMGGLKDGFTYEAKHTGRPEKSKRFYSKELIGSVARDELPNVNQVCATIPMPQLKFRHGVRIEEDCRHWVQWATKKLEDEGLLRTGRTA